MEIKVNNQIEKFPENCSIQLLVDEIINEKQKGIAIAVNNQVIKKEYWQEYFLKQNDEVLIIKATQGG
ncbi:MAG: thiamine biosynthesis protein ThiS [Bacteroidetes bacterium CG02_land_8_20_14_3_00_31_25]|nr:MAG: thiamine biosynthesis protein ThiS [Bacteroidetes bacterium CG02_land_8_20_14_3_00_31_25]